MSDGEGKYCNRCGIRKLYSEFYKDKSKRDGFHTICKSCNKQNRLDNIEKRKAYEIEYEKTKRNRPENYIKNHNKKYYEEHKNEIKQYQKEYNESHKNEKHEYNQEYYKTHKDEIKTYNKSYKPRRNELRNERKQNDEQYKILENCRNRIYYALKGCTKSCKTIELLGCTTKFLKEWFEFQFYDGMNWDNYGEYWHVDHVKPCTSFDLVDSEEQKICFNWRNLAPLRANKNLSKSNRRNMFAEVLQELKVKVYLSLLNNGSS